MADWTFSKQMDGDRDFILYLDIDLDSQDIAANKSVVSWKLYAVDNDSINLAWSNYSSDWEINVGSASSGKKSSFDFRDGDTETIASGTKTITHSADGTKSFTATGEWDTDHSSVGSAKVSGSVTLPRIPRGPRVRVSGTWRNTVAYVRVSGTWRIAVPYVRTGGSWKIGGG